MRVIREYKKAESLEEAWQLNQKKSNRVLGGMVLAGQGEVDQVQQGGVDGADDGQGVPAVGRGAGDVSEVAGKVIRGIGHEVLQQS